MVKKTKVFICGLGKIGFKYDFEDSANGKVLTHAKAFAITDSFELVGGSDPEIINRNLFQTCYGVPCFSSLSEGLNNTKPELLVLSCPTETHLREALVAVQQPSVKYVLCEKPLAWNLDDSQKIVDLLKAHRIRLFVNYMRRVNPVVVEIKNRFLKEKLWIKGFGSYTKGLINNGSHLVNLLQYWFGDACEWVIANNGRTYGEFDHEKDFYLKFSKASFFFQYKCAEDYEDNSLQIHTSDGILNYSYGGRVITWNPVSIGENKTKILESNHKSLVSHAETSQLHVALSIAKELNGVKTDLCTGVQALETSRVVSEIIKEKQIG